MMRFFKPFLNLVLFILMVWGGTGSDCQAAASQVLHEVFLANTEHELHVYRIYGRKPGKTLMLIGGIQGDEPGGYLTADLYADITLKQGTLIVVPRANFYSILLSQREGLTGDMNRKFGKNENLTRSMEEEIVGILKSLISQADCLLNLHEGSGYYNPQWVNNLENPQRYGQSIIYDAPTYHKPGEQKPLALEYLAVKVIDQVNRQIPVARYHFRPNNHDTLSDVSSHKEQRQSATYYALTQAYIPAFGVETTKEIRSLEEKIHLQKLVINTFMAELDILSETPGMHIENPLLSYVLVRVNGGLPYAVPNGFELDVAPGDDVVVTDIIANYTRGLVADIEGIGTRNDTNLPFRISRSTRIVIRKDSESCGWINLNLKSSSGLVAAAKEPPLRDLQAEKLLVNANGVMKFLDVGKELLVETDKPLILQGVRCNIASLDNDIMINLKGYAPPKSVNDGNDINFPIYPGQDLWVRYSENKKGLRYPVEATYKDRVIGRFWIRLPGSAGS